MMMRNKRIWLCVPPLLLFVCDFGLTLAHQPESWWQGWHDTMNEANPLAREVMRCGPAVSVTAGVFYGLAFAALLAFWRNFLAPVLAFFLTLGHAVGASTWLVVFYETWGIVAALCLLIVAERLLEWSWHWSGIRLKSPNG